MSAGPPGGPDTADLPGPLHADALARLREWAAPEEAQEVLRRRYVGHLATHPLGLTRDCRPDHVTASTLVLDADGGRVLLTLHAKARRWFQLGGHCEPGDQTLVAAARREALEESGLTAETLHVDPVPVQLSEHAVPFCRADGDPVPTDVASTTHHLDVRFVAVAAPGAEHTLSAESLDLRWWPVAALPVTPEDPQPDLVDLVRLARARLGAR